MPRVPRGLSPEINEAQRGTATRPARPRGGASLRFGLRRFGLAAKNCNNSPTRRVNKTRSASSNNMVQLRNGAAHESDLHHLSPGSLSSHPQPLFRAVGDRGSHQGGSQENGPGGSVEPGRAR